MACAIHSTGRATTHAPTPTLHPQAQRVMRSAWARARQGRLPFAEALRQAWAIEKGITAEGARRRQAALTAAITPPPGASLPPQRRHRPNRTATHARRERRVTVHPRRTLTVQIGRAFTHSLQVIAEWNRAGCPAFSSSEAAAIGVVIDACIGLLDAAESDTDREADYTTCERAPDGGCLNFGRSSDDEPSLCGVGSHTPGGNNPGTPVCGFGYGDDLVDIESDEADDEDDGSFEPSLGSLDTVGNPLFHTPDPWPGVEVSFRGDQTHWADGSADDMEAGDDTGLGDEGGLFEAYGQVLFASAEDFPGRAVGEDTDGLPVLDWVAPVHRPH